MTRPETKKPAAEKQGDTKPEDVHVETETSPTEPEPQTDVEDVDTQPVENVENRNGEAWPISAIEAMAEASARIAELEAQIAELTPEPVETSKKAKKIKLPDSVDDEQFQGACTIVFVNEQGVLITELPPLNFSTDQFTGGSNERTLMADIEFPRELPARHVAAIYLLDGNNKPVSVSELVQPLPVCGGRASRINKGSLLFRGKPKAVKAA